MLHSPACSAGLLSAHPDCAGAEGIYDEDDLDDDEFYPEDELDPDNMTYEVRLPCRDCSLFLKCSSLTSQRR